MFRAVPFQNLCKFQHKIEEIEEIESKTKLDRTQYILIDVKSFRSDSIQFNSNNFAFKLNCMQMKCNKIFILGHKLICAGKVYVNHIVVSAFS